MYIINGIAYAGELSDGFFVTDAKILDALYLLVDFSTGEQRVFDVSVLLPYPAFAPLADSAVFKSVKAEDGMLTWQNGEIDIAPEAVYAKSFAYESLGA